MIKIDEEVQGLLKSTNQLAKDTFANEDNMKDFLTTLSKLYNVSYNNILLLKTQRDELNLVASKEKFIERGINVKDNEKPLKIIKGIKSNGEIEFKLDEVYDISQTDRSIKQNKARSKEYVENILKGMCERRNIAVEPDDSIRSKLEKIIIDIKNNTRQNDSSKNKNMEEYNKQVQVEIEGALFAVTKNLKLNTRNYNFNEICNWGKDKKDKTLKQSLKYIQKFTNYFVSDFKSQEKINASENKKEDEEEFG